MIRVLIIKLSSIGDVVHTLPSLYALRKGFEESGVRAEIDWLVEEAASSILVGHPMIDNLIVVKNRGWINNRMENVKTARRLGARRYDIVLDFQGLMKSGIWVLLSKGKRRIGFANARELSHVFLNEKVAPEIPSPPVDQELHAVDRYLMLARHAVGVKADPDSAVEFPMPEMAPHIARVGRLFKKYGFAAGPKAKGFFAIVPHARWQTKLWGDDPFVELAKSAIALYDMDAVLIGGPMDRGALEKMRQRIGERAINLAGETDLAELAALFSKADFVVTVDSGPMHIAAAVGTPVVALFGPTSPERTGPYGRRDGRDGISGRHIVVTKKLDCSPCFKRRCPEPVCMTGITVEEVLAAVERGAGAGRGGGKKLPC
jgi:lipopolysaccharide heptosyltransferase I